MATAAAAAGGGGGGGGRGGGGGGARDDTLSVLTPLRNFARSSGLGDRAAYLRATPKDAGARAGHHALQPGSCGAAVAALEEPRHGAADRRAPARRRRRQVRRHPGGLRRAESRHGLVPRQADARGRLSVGRAHVHRRAVLPGGGCRLAAWQGVWRVGRRDEGDVRHAVHGVARRVRGQGQDAGAHLGPHGRQPGAPQEDRRHGRVAHLPREAGRADRRRAAGDEGVRQVEGRAGVHGVQQERDAVRQEGHRVRVEDARRLDHLCAQQRLQAGGARRVLRAQRRGHAQEHGDPRAGAARDVLRRDGREHQERHARRRVLGDAHADGPVGQGVHRLCEDRLHDRDEDGQDRHRQGGAVRLVQHGQSGRLGSTTGGGSEAIVSVDGKEVFKALTPDEDLQKHCDEMGKKHPDYMPYFFLQHDDYITLKETATAHILSGAEGAPPGMATIDIAVETLRVAEYLTPYLQKALA